MYAVSDAFKTAIKSTSRTFAFKMDITEADNTVVTVTDDDIIQNSMSLATAVMQDGVYAPGAAFAGDFGVTLISNAVLDAINYSTSTLTPSVGLLLPDRTTEYVPLGIFYPDDISRKNGFISISGFDGMIKFDKPIGKVTWANSSTMLTILQNICAYCGVPLGTTDFINSTIVIPQKVKNTTCRTVIQYIAALAGCWARIDRTGKLVLEYPNYMKATGVYTYAETYDTSNRFDFTGSQEQYSITEVICAKGGFTPLPWGSTTSDVYNITLDYSNNPLLQGDYAVNTAAMEAAYNAIVEYWPPISGYSSNWQGNPALDVGDLVQQTDRNGNVYSCLVGKSVYYYRGSCSMSHDITVDNSSSSVSTQVETLSTTVNETAEAVTTYAGLATYANNVYTVTLSGITALKDGMAVAFKVDTDCAAPSLQINALTAAPIKQDTGDALDCHAGGIYEVRYNSTNQNFIG